LNPVANISTSSAGISTTQFLVVLALMLILMVGGLAGLTQRRSRRLTSWHWLDRLSDIVLSKDPRQTVLLLRYLVGAANSVAGVAALNFGVSTGVLEPESVSWLTAAAIFCAIGFYAAMRMGLNRRLADPSMATPQIICAVLFLAWGYTLGGRAAPSPCCCCSCS